MVRALWLVRQSERTYFSHSHYLAPLLACAGEVIEERYFFAALARVRKLAPQIFGLPGLTLARLCLAFL